MMKYILILVTVVYLAQSQRPPYAGSSNRYPVVLPQFIEGQAAAAAAAAASDTLANRIDAENGNNVNSLPGSSANGGVAATPTVQPDLPIDAHGDIDLINRIKTWPKEKQPFWFINWQQIQAHRGDANNRAQPSQTQPNTRSFFAG